MSAYPVFVYIVALSAIAKRSAPSRRTERSMKRKIVFHTVRGLGQNRKVWEEIPIPHGSHKNNINLFHHWKLSQTTRRSLEMKSWICPLSGDQANETTSTIQKDSLQPYHVKTEESERRKNFDVNTNDRDGLGEKRKKGTQSLFQVPNPQK